MLAKAVAEATDAQITLWEFSPGFRVSKSEEFAGNMWNRRRVNMPMKATARMTISFNVQAVNGSNQEKELGMK